MVVSPDVFTLNILEAFPHKAVEIVFFHKVKQELNKSSIN